MMRHWLRQLIPSMFRRRLALVSLGLAGAFGLLLLQLGRLTLGQSRDFAAQAERALVERRLIPTVRGRILDARNRVLAMDQATFDVQVMYPVLSGEWAYRQARRAAYKANPDRWHRLDRLEREALIAQYQATYDAQVESLWDTLATLSHRPRAELDDRLRIIRQRVEMVAADVWARQRAARIGDDVPSTRVEFRPISEQLAPHSVLRDISDAVRSDIERRIWQARQTPANLEPEAELWKLVAIAPARKREYPLTQMHLRVDRSHLPGPLRQAEPLEMDVAGVGLHILGTLRDIWKEDIQGTFDRQGNLVTPGRPYRWRDAQGRENIDLGGYLPGDQRGSWGIESACEEQLRGLRGQQLRLLDQDREIRTEPTPGQDVQLSIDIQLQARIQAILSPELGLMRGQPWHRAQTGEEPDTVPEVGETLNGCAVVLDIGTGQVLAAVSMPGFTMDDLRTQPDKVYRDYLNRPFINRAVAMPYEPGSTLKPAVLVAAVTAGLHAPADTITCNGFLDPAHPNHFRCWIFKTAGGSHGPLHGPEALARSCNVFFYTLGRELGPQRLIEALSRLHLGRSTGCGLEEEVAGDLPRIRQDGSLPGVGVNEATLLGIGQGPVRWTPVQAAAMYAALARGGYWIKPSFVRAINGRPVPQEGEDLRLDPRGIDMALDGLDDAVNKPYGTSHHLTKLDKERIFNIEGVRVAGKSGTATAAPLRIDSNRDGRITREDQIVRTGDHAWFIGLVKREGETRARYVVAVVVEYAGSGGAVAAPIANQILYALRAEGYL